MTVFFHTGFDLFGAANNAANDGPAQFAGLANNPAKPTTATAGTAGRTLIGVSTLPQYKLGKGAEQRQALTVWNSAAAVSDGATTVTFPIVPAVVTNSVGQRAVFGFRFKRQRLNVSPVPPNAWWPLFMINGGIAIGVNIPNGLLYFGATTPTRNFVFIEGQEYYIELEYERTLASSSNSVRLRMYIDGQQFGPDVMTNPVTFNSFAWQAPAGNYTWNTVVSYGDVYIGDELLGPQMVISRQPSVALESNWIPSEGTNGLALITGVNTNNDTKYISSPVSGVAEDRYRLDFDIPATYKAHASSLYIRAKRDEASSRRVKIGVFNQQTNEELAAAAAQNLVFSQNEFQSALMWASSDPVVLEPYNLNNLAIALTSPLS